jgi:hypothetical protein
MDLTKMDFIEGTAQLREGTPEEHRERELALLQRAFGTTDMDEIWRQITKTVQEESVRDFER